jgi:hypothetical protein
VRKVAYAAMHSMPTALFVATESSAIAENGAIKLAKAEQDEETRRIKTQENQGHFSALRLGKPYRIIISVRYGEIVFK